MTLMTLSARYLSILSLNPLISVSPLSIAPDRALDVLVGQMLELHKHLQTATSEAEHGVRQRQIEATDQQIDALVYALYGLTGAKVAVVEGKELSADK
jgi:hypothetical protein